MTPQTIKLSLYHKLYDSVELLWITASPHLSQIQSQRLTKLSRSLLKMLQELSIYPHTIKLTLFLLRVVDHSSQILRQFTPFLHSSPPQKGMSCPLYLKYFQSPKLLSSSCQYLAPSEMLFVYNNFWEGRNFVCYVYHSISLPTK